MYTNSNNKEQNNEIKNSLEDFLSDNKQNIKNQECNDDVCYINDGKEIVERIEKKLVTNDGRRLLI